MNQNSTIADYHRIDSKVWLKKYIKEDRTAMGVRRINPFRWIIGEDCPRMCFYLYILRWLEYSVNKCKMGSINKILFTPLMFLLTIWHRRQSYKYGVHIGVNTCDYGLRIVHPGGIIINANHVGKYCTVTQGVVLGKVKTNERRPYVGDNVNFSLGAKVTGLVHIGNNVVICPNSVVISDIPDNVIASGVPVSIIKELKKK